MELKHYIRIIWKRLWILIALPLAAGCISVYVSMNMPSYYMANTTLYVVDPSVNSRIGIDYSQVMAGEFLTKDYAELIKSRAVAEGVINKLGLKREKPESISRRIVVNAVNGTRVLEISITDRSPTMAMKLANAVASEFSASAVELMKVNNVSIIDKAQKPEKPSGPNKTAIVELAVLAALVLAGLTVFFLEYLDNTIKTTEDVEKYLGLNVIGTVPMLEIK